MSMKPDGQDSIMEHHARGVEVLKGLSGGKYGKEVINRRAEELGISPSYLYLDKRLAERLTIDQARAADKAGMPYVAVVPLLCYAPSPSEKLRAERNPSICRSVTTRTAKVSEFINCYARKELTGVAFTEAVRDWRTENIHLWSPGKQSRCMYDHKVQLTKIVANAESLAKNYTARLRECKKNGSAVPDELAKVEKARRLIQKAATILGDVEHRSTPENDLFQDFDDA